MDKSPSSSLASSSSKGEKDWVFLKEGTNDNFDNIVSMKIPYNTIRTSHKQTNCKLNNNINKHKYKIERRECKGHNEDIGGEQVRVKCPVEYKVEFCEQCNNFRIHQDNEHVIQCDDIIENELIHPEAEIVGIHPKVKVILNELITKNVQYLLPAQAHIYLNQESVRKNEMKGLPMPTKAQVTYYIRNYRNSNNIQSNRISDLKELIKEYKISPDENRGFFFWVRE